MSSVVPIGCKVSLLPYDPQVPPASNLKSESTLLADSEMYVVGPFVTSAELMGLVEGLLCRFHRSPECRLQEI